MSITRRVRTRFAPSPTGLMHIGNLRTALYAYTLAKHFDGDFILRIEDTDQKRQVTDSIPAIQRNLQTFGIHWDEYYLQSKRKEQGIYQRAAQKLLDEGHAFYCQCQGRDAKHQGYSEILRDPCRDKKLTSGAVKLYVPDGQTVEYTDFVHQKAISWSTDTVYDATLLKTDGFPTYHLAAMVDDIDMDISHIMRGHDWMPSTPIHLLVFQYLGGQQPEIGHLTDILSPAGGKLSKRRDSVFCESFIKQGYLPEALLNFIMLLGWAPKDNRELYTLADFVTYFDPAGFQKANPVFYPQKLDFFNQHYLQAKSDTEFASLVTSFLPDFSADEVTTLVPILKTRLTKLADAAPQTRFIKSPIDYDGQLLLTKGTARELALDMLTQSSRLLSDLQFDFATLQEKLLSLIKSNDWNTGEFFMVFRVAIAGSQYTLPIVDCLPLLGQAETINRLKTAINKLG